MKVSSQAGMVSLCMSSPLLFDFSSEKENFSGNERHATN